LFFKAYGIYLLSQKCLEKKFAEKTTGTWGMDNEYPPFLA
jgi:hypothetical protein